MNNDIENIRRDAAELRRLADERAERQFAEARGSEDTCPRCGKRTTAMTLAKWAAMLVCRWCLWQKRIGRKP